MRNKIVLYYKYCVISCWRCIFVVINEYKLAGRPWRIKLKSYKIKPDALSPYFSDDERSPEVPMDTTHVKCVFKISNRTQSILYNKTIIYFSINELDVNISLPWFSYISFHNEHKIMVSSSSITRMTLLTKWRSP